MKRSKSSRVVLESLETRRMNSVSSYPLLIQAGNGGSQIEFHYDAALDVYKWSVNGKNYATPFTDPSAIYIQGGSGNDNVTVSNTKPGTNVYITGGGGNDTVGIGGSVGKLGYQNSGNVFVDGANGPGTRSGGNEKLILSAYNDANPNFTDQFDVYNDHVHIGGADNNNVPVIGINVTYTNIDDLTLLGPANAPATFNVHSVNYGTPTHVLGGFKADTVNIGDGDLNSNIMDALTLSNVGFGDHVNIDDSNGAAGHLYDLNNQLLTGFSVYKGSIRVSEESALKIYGTNYDDLFRTGGAMWLKSVSVFGRGGNDTFNIGGDDLKLENINSTPLYMYGGKGNDTLILSDGQANYGQAYHLDFMHFSSSIGVTSLYHASMENIIIGGAKGDNAFDVLPSSFSKYTLLAHELIPAQPGGDLSLGLYSSSPYGAKNPSFQASGPGNGTYTFSNRQPITINGFGNYPKSFPQKANVNPAVTTRKRSWERLFGDLLIA